MIEEKVNFCYNYENGIKNGKKNIDNLIKEKKELNEKLKNTTNLKKIKKYKDDIKIVDDWINQTKAINKSYQDDFKRNNCKNIINKNQILQKNIRKTKNRYMIWLILLPAISFGLLYLIEYLVAFLGYLFNVPLVEAIDPTTLKWYTILGNSINSYAMYLYRRNVWFIIMTTINVIIVGIEIIVLMFLYFNDSKDVKMK